ncbi:MAG: CCA tRNA nucleotidyltransferase [Acidobacteriota bacterium]|nr:CCA tRNA nucleotidyltransferase [Acidobacteriota bacterium]
MDESDIVSHSDDKTDLIDLSSARADDCPCPAGPPPHREPRPVLLRKGEHPISRREIDPDVFKIINRLHGFGFTAYVVGGAVRDMLLGLVPKDFDIVTDARPGQIKKRFSNAFLIGRRFRLAHIHFGGGKVIEVATFRKDPGPETEPAPSPSGEAEEPGGPERAEPAADHSADDAGIHLPPGEDREHPDAGPGGRLRRRPPRHHQDMPDIYGMPYEDAFRRDTTINALFFDVLTSTVIDYVGGLEDIARRKVRIIGDPSQRFIEDPVRIWRVVRQSARLNFQIDEATELAIPTHCHLLASVPGARLFEELNKDLKGGAKPVIGALVRFGILGQILGRPGKEYESDPELFSGLDKALEALDRAVAEEPGLTLEEMYALLFWPCVKAKICGVRGDVIPILNDMFAASGIVVTIPRSMRAHIANILAALSAMDRALKTGHMRWSLKRRAHYSQASFVFFLLEKGFPPPREEGEPFEILFRQAYPSGGPGRRRRPRRKRPPAKQGGSL